MWSDDDTLTTRIDPAVAHYTGQAELAEAIQDGLAAKAVGRRPTRRPRSSAGPSSSPPRPATTRPRPGCARSSRSTTPDTGTVRLKRSVDKLDEMALDTASTKTTRVKK